MEQSSIIFAFVFAVISIIIGFLIYSIFFRPWTTELRPRFRGALKKFFRWIKRRAKKIVLILLLVAVACILIYAGVRYGNRLISIIVGFLSNPKSTIQSLDKEVTTRTVEPEEKARESIIADHSIVNMVRLDQIPESAVELARANLHIVFAFGPHGSQIAYGLKDLPSFKGPLYEGLDIVEIEFEDNQEYPDLDTWVDSAGAFLDDPQNQQTNVVMWSWSDKLISASAEEVEAYLKGMSELEEEYPEVRFVYMTGHMDGTELTGNVHLRNEQIRNYCLANHKILYDFADIESYDPDGNYYADKRVNDACWYDSDGDGSLDKNWARDWSEANPTQWYNCYSAHTFPLNANMKAYAAWWLFVKLAGWSKDN